MKKLYYIKERHNPQIGVHYYAMGKMTKADAKKTVGKCLYGINVIREYTLEEYTNKCKELNVEVKL